MEEEIELTPSFHGKDCKGNGEHKGIECQCDECDYYLICYPEWAPGGSAWKEYHDADNKHYKR